MFGLVRRNKTESKTDYYVATACSVLRHLLCDSYTRPDADIIINTLLSSSHRPADVRAAARLQPSPGDRRDVRHQRSAEQPRRGSRGRERRDGRGHGGGAGRASPPQPAGFAVAGHEPGDAEGARAELDAHTQGRTGARGVPAVPVQRGLPLHALRLQGAPDALPLHAPGLRLQLLRQDAVRATHGPAREVRTPYYCHFIRY